MAEGIHLEEVASPDTYKVVDAIVDGLTSQRPQTRYVVGLEAKLSVFVSYFPTFIADYVLRLKKHEWFGFSHIKCKEVLVVSFRCWKRGLVPLRCSASKGPQWKLLIDFLPPQGGTLGVPGCIHTKTKNICWKSKKCVCNGRSILDLTKLSAHGRLG